MSHLSETRFVNLAVVPDASASATERAHLAICHSCAVRLQQELALSDALRAIVLPEAPAGLERRLNARFQDAMRVRNQRRIVALVLISTALGVVLALAVLWLLAMNAGAVTRECVRWTRELLVAAGAARTVFGSVPGIGGAMLAATAASMVAAAWTFARAMEAAESPTNVKCRPETLRISA